MRSSVLHSHGRGVAAMMPAVICQAQLAWDANAKQPWSDRGGAPKASFYNLAGELQCEVILPHIFLTCGDVVFAANWEGERLRLIPNGFYIRLVLVGCQKTHLLMRMPSRAAAQETLSAQDQRDRSMVLAQFGTVCQLSHIRAQMGCCRAAIHRAMPIFRCFCC